MFRTATGGVLIGLALACGDRESGSGSEVTAGELVAYVATWRETEERVCLARAGRHFLDVNASEPGVGVLALLSADDGQGRIVAEAEPRGLESPPRPPVGTVWSRGCDSHGAPCEGMMGDERERQQVLAGE